MGRKREKRKRLDDARKGSRYRIKKNTVSNEDNIWSEENGRREAERDNTICGSGLRREAEPTRVEGSEYAAAGKGMGWESCACQAWGQVQHALR